MHKLELFGKNVGLHNSVSVGYMLRVTLNVDYLCDNAGL